MRSHLKRNLLLAVALAAVTGGVLIAVLVPGSSHPVRSERPAARGGEVELAARYLGVPVATLRQDLRSGHTLAELADATPGRSAAGLVDALVSARTARIKSQALPAGQEKAAIGRLRKRVLGAVKRRRAASVIALAADYLGLSVEAVDKRLASARTLANVADSVPDRSSVGLIDAIVSTRRERLAAALRAHEIAAGQERSALATLREHVRAQVERKR